MSYTWFKLHHDMPDDIKLRRFTPQEKWAWVALLCLASKSATRGIIEAEDDDIADYCEFNNTQDWLYYRDKLIAKGMLEIGGDGNIHILHWEDRQYDKPSDRPEAVKERVRKHRSKKKNPPQKKDETPCNALQTRSNADETPQTRSDTDTDTDQKTESLLNTHTLSKPSEPERESPDFDSSGLNATQNAVARFERGFLRTAYPWTGDRQFIDYLLTQWEGKDGKPPRSRAETFILNQEMSGNFAKLEIYWRNYQEEKGAGGNTPASENVIAAIGRELHRLNRSGVLPDNWQQKTGCSRASELSAKDAAEYLAYLRSQGGAA